MCINISAQISVYMLVYRQKDLCIQISASCSLTVECKYTQNAYLHKKLRELDLCLYV